ncbi:RnfABCDGE type electron transport complex subunit D [Thermoleptolyngbya sp. C42_A2020_037]|uniref:RnfABCDGE type electron transport complex subunit D n=1 Tax=Thermoleptolyngbya sp. C42_A2020_037 TaxID=2747799 RepID=UPI0019F3ECC9|nr:RnfABCDGE type electron transport complex subunit D [Thermoleptolyngbya sp. C42_A2020_037]MBF2084234.1 RnfABCDGE type electron transport complex subunit D [Thermoleptolyngbya sp. C42_A2020_037]
MAKDARLYQIGFLALFLLLGVGTRDWSLNWVVVLTAIATCLITQALCGAVFYPPELSNPETAADNKPADNIGQRWRAIALRYRNPQILSSLPSALVTGLGMSLLLRVDHPLTMALAVMGAIASKFLLRLRGKHVFNPGNFGIVMALMLSGDAWVSPGQWGESGWYGLLFLGAGGLVLQQVGRWDTSAAFLGSYAVLEAGRNLWLGWTWDVWAHRLTSGSLLVFALFMITDPRTIPNSRTGRLIWAGAIALVTFILRNVFFISTAPFWALFALAPLSLLLDWLLPAARFEWSQSALHLPLSFLSTFRQKYVPE